MRSGCHTLMHHELLDDTGDHLSAGRAEGPDISQLAPHLQEEWDHERNAHLGPITITPGSAKVVWWTQGLCASGEPHRWAAAVRYRTRGRGCPYGKGNWNTGGKLACPCNDLAHNYPAVAAELDLDPDDPRTAESILAGSAQKAHWRCGVCNHRWCATIQDRTRRSGCPECFQRARSGPRTKHPSIAKGRPGLLVDWDYALNSQAGWHPDKVTLMSSLRIHWIRTNECRLGKPHRWQATPGRRIVFGQGSPFPSGNAVCECNSLARNCKDAAAFWDPLLNSDTPEEVTIQSSKLRHWITPEGERWQQRICEVVRNCWRQSGHENADRRPQI